VVWSRPGQHSSIINKKARSPRKGQLFFESVALVEPLSQGERLSLRLEFNCEWMSGGNDEKGYYRFVVNCFDGHARHGC
jgi:hypothetical protein